MFAFPFMQWADTWRKQWLLQGDAWGWVPCVCQLLLSSEQLGSNEASRWGKAQTIGNKENMTLSRRIAEWGQWRLVPEWMGVCRETLWERAVGLHCRMSERRIFLYCFKKDFFLMTETSGSENVAGWNKAFCFVLFSLHSFVHFLRSFPCRASMLSMHSQRCCWCGNNVELHTVLLQIDHFSCIFHKAQPRRQVFYHCVEGDRWPQSKLACTPLVHLSCI